LETSASYEARSAPSPYPTVSSNTPFFFNGMRVQIFPNQKLKIEPWLINGWQSYGRFNSRPGLGFQVLYRPTGTISFVSNGYGIGEDTLGSRVVCATTATTASSGCTT